MVPSTVELVTGCHESIRAIARELVDLRRALSDIASKHGLAIMACGTHPFSDWIDQSPTPKPRYRRLADTIQTSSLRSHACGLHIHVGIENKDQRLSVLNGVQQYLPIFVALSTSSPFWRERNTGLMSYRTAVNSELPRSGLPGIFNNIGEYRDYVTALTGAELAPDESYVWWSVRLSSRFPTVELRAPDCCSRPADAVCLAALFRSLAMRLAEHPRKQRASSNVCRLLNGENVWQAARQGTDAVFVDIESGQPQSLSEALSNLIDLIMPEAKALDCASDVQATRSILETGTSADLQLAIHTGALREGASPEEAAEAVARGIAEASLAKSVIAA